MLVPVYPLEITARFEQRYGILDCSRPLCAGDTNVQESDGHDIELAFEVFAVASFRCGVPDVES